MKKKGFFYLIIILIIVVVLGYFSFRKPINISPSDTTTQKKSVIDEPKVPFYPCNDSLEKCS